MPIFQGQAEGRPGRFDCLNERHNKRSINWAEMVYFGALRAAENLNEFSIEKRRQCRYY
jgi:hypothetical protein